MSLDNLIKEQIRHLIEDLVAKRYIAIEDDGRAGRLTAEEIKTAIADYKRVLIDIPDEGWDLVDIYPRQEMPETIVLDVPLWTMEEGRSDLTLSISAIKVGGSYLIRIEDIHVP